MLESKWNRSDKITIKRAEGEQKKKPMCIGETEKRKRSKEKAREYL